MSSSDEAAGGDSLFGDFFVNTSYVATALSFGEGPALRTLRLQARCCGYRRLHAAACLTHSPLL